jgi:transposase-like protein
MARFKCKNCGNLFNASVMHGRWDLHVRCPKCESDWVDYLGPDNEWGGWPRNTVVYQCNDQMLQTSEYKAWRSGWQG